MLIALGLAVITGIEVAISYAKGLGDAANPLLIILAVIKFGIVVGFFMHLRFERPIVPPDLHCRDHPGLDRLPGRLLHPRVFTGTHGHHR